MPRIISPKLVLCTLAAAAVLSAPLRAPSPAKAPPPPFAPVADLFDPRLIAEAMCGRDATLRESPIMQGAIAAVPKAPVPSRADLPRSPKFETLGTLSYKITTTSPEAQAFFDQGLRLFYAFNPGEAVASFRAATDADPTCAMCYWGEALTLGPNLNAGMFDENNPAAVAAVAKAQEFAAGASPREQALIAAVAKRYSADPKAKRDDLDLAYADAMKTVYADYKGDDDIASIMAEAAMNIRSDPWSRWWDKTGRVPTGYLAGAIAALETTLARRPDHPGAIHLYIHALDGSVSIAKVEPYADRLAALMPGAGHMVHMPAHTFFSLGRYKDALTTNVAAITVDDAYLKGPAAATGVYRDGLYQHNVHFALAAADMAGDEASAMRLVKVMNDFQASKPGFSFEVSAAAAIHPIVRFRTADEMLAIPRPARDQAYMTGIWHYARGTAYVHQKDLRRARAEAAAIDKLRTGKKPKATDMYGDLLGVAAEVVRGRIAAAEGRWQDAADHFGSAIWYQDKVEARDPPFWDFPVRELQGVALLRAGKLQHAAETLRHALLEAPNSGYALYALQQVSAAIGDNVAAAEYGKLFTKAWVGAAPPDLNRF